MGDLLLSEREKSDTEIDREIERFASRLMAGERVDMTEANRLIASRADRLVGLPSADHLREKYRAIRMNRRLSILK